MLFSSWLVSRKLRSFRRKHVRRFALPPSLERLEGRSLPSVYVVTSAADGGPGSLRAAINQANADAALGISDTISFDTAQMGTGTITLTQGQLVLTAGAGTTTIDGGGQVAVSGGGTTRVFQVDSGAQGVLTGLTIRDGFGSPAGINNAGTLTVSHGTHPSEGHRLTQSVFSFRAGERSIHAAACCSWASW